MQDESDVGLCANVMTISDDIRGDLVGVHMTPAVAMGMAKGLAMVVKHASRHGDNPMLDTLAEIAVLLIEAEPVIGMASRNENMRIAMEAVRSECNLPTRPGRN